jgi:hypothetical protein
MTFRIECLGSARQERDEDQEWNRNAEQPEQNQSHRRLLECVLLECLLFAVGPRADDAGPLLVAELAALDGGEAGGESADEH